MANTLKQVKWPNSKTWASYMKADNEVVVGGQDL